MSNFIKFLKLVFPYFFIILFIFLIFNYYQSNKSEFVYLYNIHYKYLITVIIMCFFYLITETLILILIINHFKKQISFKHSFLIICCTYFCNTFIQFSGLGFRAYYLKKYFDISVKNFVFLSLYFILIELLIFSLLGLFSIQIFEIIYLDSSLILEIKLFLLLIFLSIFLGIQSQDKIINFLKIKNFFVFDTLINFLNDKTIMPLNYSLLKACKYYAMQFFLLSGVFYVGYLILDRPDPLYLSFIASTFTDFSFIFTLTPYAIGISETFLYLSNMNFDLKISEILFLSNIFRLSMFIIYFPFGAIFLIYLLKFKKNG